MEEQVKEEIKELVKKEVSTEKELPSSTLNAPTYEYDKNKTMDENAVSLVELKATQQASEDEEFIGKIAETKKQSITSSATANKDIQTAKKVAEKIEALTQVDNAFYTQWKYVLNWGGIKEPTKKVFAIFMLVLILPFYTVVTLGITLPISIVKTLLSTINALVEEIKTFGKLSRSIAVSILILGALATVGYVIFYFLKKYGVVTI